MHIINYNLKTCKAYLKVTCKNVLCFSLTRLASTLRSDRKYIRFIKQSVLCWSIMSITHQIQSWTFIKQPCTNMQPQDRSYYIQSDMFLCNHTNDGHFGFKTSSALVVYNKRLTTCQKLTCKRDFQLICARGVIRAYNNQDYLG